MESRDLGFKVWNLLPASSVPPAEDPSHRVRIPIRAGAPPWLEPP